VIGPTGTKDLMTNLERAYGADIRIRIADEHLPPEGVRVVAEEFAADGVVYEMDGVRLTAFEVDHGAEIKPAYGYRIDCQGRSVVLSGDTRFNENVVKHATGADVLVHEVMAARPELPKDEAFQRIMAHHTSPRRPASSSDGQNRSSPFTPILCCRLGRRFRRSRLTSLSRKPAKPTPARWKSAPT
jgi:ribonuclease Z